MYIYMYVYEGNEINPKSQQMQLIFVYVMIHSIKLRLLNNRFQQPCFFKLLTLQTYILKLNRNSVKT